MDLWQFRSNAMIFRSTRALNRLVDKANREARGKNKEKVSDGLVEVLLGQKGVDFLRSALKERAEKRMLSTRAKRRATYQALKAERLRSVHRNSTSSRW